MDNPPTGNAASMIERIKAILLKPKETWPVIAAEPATPGDLMTRWALPLIAVGPIAGFIGGQLFGFGALFVHFRPSLMSGLTGAITGFVGGLIAAVALALIADALAPKFGGQSDRSSAFKLIVYGATAGWVGGIFGLIPGLFFVSILCSIYSLYLIYTGVTPLMKVPQDKAVGYTAVTLICAIVLMAVVLTVTRTLTGSPVGYQASNGDGQVTVAGLGTVDTEKMNAATKQLEGVANGTQQPASGSALQALLPGSIGAYQRTATESTAIGKMGSNAEGTYTAGDNTFRLKVTDMAAIGALAGLGAAMGVEQNREDANGYERTGTVDGQMQSEQWNKTDGTGSFRRMVGGRFMIEADGKTASIDELKAAVATVDQSKLVALAK